MNGARFRFGRWMLGGIAIVALTAAIGVSLSRADAPPGRYTIATSYVLDTVTGLYWERAPSATLYNAAQAQAYCADLFTPDSSDWRLPSMKELQTLIDESRNTPAIDLTAFPNAPSGFVWTGTPVAEAAGATWTVNFTRGETDVATSTATVRCVR